MSLAGSQQRTFLQLLETLRPHWRQDTALPSRIQAFFAARRGIGSRDRRLYRELAFTALRYLPWIEARLAGNPDDAVKVIAWLAADLPATRAFRAAVAGDWPATPESIAARAEFLKEPATALLPEWFRPHCPALFESPELDFQVKRAPLWLRLQTNAPEKIFAEFKTLGWTWTVSEILPQAVWLHGDVDVKRTDAFHTGQLEVQDLGSQLLLETVAALSRPPTTGVRWLDACAGAGGKTLQLARKLGPTGHVDAHDIRPAALEELQFRVVRAKIQNVSVLQKTPADAYDGVLVDAPCSGSGTWRRAPHLKWATSESDVAAAATRQGELLSRFSERVRAGGLLVYATCSLSRRENEDVAAAFLAKHSDFRVEAPVHDFGAVHSGAGLTIRPARFNSDGFFVAAFRRA